MRRLGQGRDGGGADVTLEAGGGVVGEVAVHTGSRF